jgi:hypothetical protein
MAFTPFRKQSHDVKELSVSAEEDERERKLKMFFESLLNR